MPTLECPECGATLRLEEEEAVLYAQIHCEECGTALEVVNESPLAVAVLDEEFDEDLEDDEDSFEDEDDDL
jgi:lysine biosynthesis protein LysW